MNKKIAELEQRIAELEKTEQTIKPFMRYEWNS